MKYKTISNCYLCDKEIVQDGIHKNPMYPMKLTWPNTVCFMEFDICLSCLPATTGASAKPWLRKLFDRLGNEK